MMDVKRERHKEVNLLCMYLQFWWKYIQKMAMQIGKYILLLWGGNCALQNSPFFEALKLLL